MIGARALMTMLLCLGLMAIPSAGRTSTPTTAPAAFSVIDRSPPPTVGTEGRLDVVLPFDDLVPATATTKADVVLRIADRRPWGTGWRYDIRYVAAVPGEFDVTRFLRRGADDFTPALPPLRVSATGVLPERHDGALEGVAGPRVGGWRWYWPLAIAGAVLWLMLIVPIAIWGRRRAVATAPAEIVRPPTVAEQLRPLVQAAAAGTLDADGQGRLERLLVHVWRRRLALGDVAPSVALQTIRQHTDGGPLLIAIENWLHRPPASRKIDEEELARLLAPYAELPAESSIDPDLTSAGERR